MQNFRELKGLIEAAEAVMGYALPGDPPIGPPPPPDTGPKQPPIEIPPMKNPKFKSSSRSNQKSYPSGDLASSKQKNEPEVDLPDWVEYFRPGKNTGPRDGYDPYPKIDLPGIFGHGIK